jgi:hypothetical protein
MGKILGYTVALSLLGGALTGVGAASATVPSMVGKTYSEASGALSKWKFPFEVSTTLGTELARNDCIVVNQVLRPASHFGATNVPAKLLLSLDCNATVASATQAGNSAGSPVGRTAKNAAAQEAWLRANPDICIKMKSSHPEWFPLKGCEGVV